MFLHYYRPYGFTTNSSSSHSILLLDEPHNQQDNMANVEDGNFGWEWFTLTSAEAKLRYLRAMIKSAGFRHNTIGPKQKQIIIDTLVPEVSGGQYVDHSSTVILPDNYYEDIPDPEFVAAYKALLLDERVVIFGGNDNEEGPDIREEGTPLLGGALDHEARAGEFVCRNDGEYWTLFHRGTGGKIRVSMQRPGGSIARVEKAPRPETVDMKITDQCMFACKYCYQDSLPTGQHAQTSTIKIFIDRLSQLQVFEVAFGGGDPLLHPDFLEILTYCRKRRIVPNFSTRDISWLYDVDKADEILRLVGAVGISVSDISEVERTETAIHFLYERGRLRKTMTMDLHTLMHKFTFHVVDGTIQQYQLDKILLGDRNVLVLGFKNKGRASIGDTKTLVKYSALESVLKTARNHDAARISVDTVLIEGKESALKKAGVNPISVDLHEGKFSMYIDAVQGTIGPSSFCASEQEQNAIIRRAAFNPDVITAEEIQRIFMAW